MLGGRRLDDWQNLVFLFEKGKSDYIIEVENDAVLVDQVVLEPWARVNLEKKFGKVNISMRLAYLRVKLERKIGQVGFYLQVLVS